MELINTAQETVLLALKRHLCSGLAKPLNGQIAGQPDFPVAIELAIVLIGSLKIMYAAWFTSNNPRVCTACLSKQLEGWASCTSACAWLKF